MVYIGFNNFIFIFLILILLFFTLFGVKNGLQILLILNI